MFWGTKAVTMTRVTKIGVQYTRVSKAFSPFILPSVFLGVCGLLNLYTTYFVYFEVFYAFCFYWEYHLFFLN